MTFSSIEESAAWGAGYDAANAGVSKLVATAELLATNAERKRIIELLGDKFDNNWNFFGESFYAAENVYYTIITLIREEK